MLWGSIGASRVQNPAKPGERAAGLGSPIARPSEVCHPVREAAEVPVRIPKLRVAGSTPVSRSIFAAARANASSPVSRYRSTLGSVDLKTKSDEEFMSLWVESRQRGQGEMAALQWSGGGAGLK